MFLSVVMEDRQLVILVVILHLAFALLLSLSDRDNSETQDTGGAGDMEFTLPPSRHHEPGC